MHIDISVLFSGHGFGINTNWVETNIFNLAIVLLIVIIYVGNALIKTIQDRKNTILHYISIVEGRLIKAEQKASLARDQLVLAQNTANALNRQLGASVEREKESGIDQANDEIRRSEQSKDDTVNFQKQTTVRRLTVELIQLACKKARAKLSEKAKTREFRNIVMDEQIEKYKTATKKKIAASEGLHMRKAKVNAATKTQIAVTLYMSKVKGKQAKNKK